MANVLLNIYEIDLAAAIIILGILIIRRIKIGKSEDFEKRDN